jgi:spore coat protein U-like protein
MCGKKTAGLKMVIAIAFFAVAAGRVTAAQVSGTMEVSAVVVPNCRFTLTPLHFGSYDPLGAHQTTDLDATATVVLSCTRNAQAAITMDQGQNPVAGTGLRALAQREQLLRYQIFRDPTRTEVWSTGANALRFQADGNNGPRYEFTVYGRIPAAQEVASGMYTDVVTATVDF